MTRFARLSGAFTRESRKITRRNRCLSSAIEPLEGRMMLVASVPDLVPNSDTGVLQTDNITNDTTPTFVGTAAIGSVVQLVTGGATVVVIGQATTNINGQWSITASTLPDGTHPIRAREGPTGPLSNPLTIVVDTRPPTGNIVDVTPDPRMTPVGSVAINFSEAVGNFNQTDVTLTRNGGAVAPMFTPQTQNNINWSVDLTAGTQLSGDYNLTVGPNITDLAGNSLVAPATDAFFIQTNRFAGGEGADRFTLMLSEDQKLFVIVAQYAGKTNTYLLPYIEFQDQAFLFDGLGGNDSLSINFVNGDPIPSKGIIFNGGAGDDELGVIGTGQEEINGKYLLLRPRPYGIFEINDREIVSDETEVNEIVRAKLLTLETPGGSDQLKIAPLRAGGVLTGQTTDGDGPHVLPETRWIDIESFSLDAGRNDLTNFNDDSIEYLGGGAPANTVGGGLGEDRLILPFVEGDIGFIKFEGGAGDDDVSVDWVFSEDPLAGRLDFEGGLGDDTAHFKGLASADGSVMPTGLDSLRVGIGNLTVNANGVGDTFFDVFNNLNISTPPGDHFITATAITDGTHLEFGIPGPAFTLNVAINFSKIEAVNIDAGEGNDIFNWLGGRGSKSLNFLGGIGDDTFNAQLNGNLQIAQLFIGFDGGLGTDQLKLRGTGAESVMWSPGAEMQSKIEIGEQTIMSDKVEMTEVSIIAILIGMFQAGENDVNIVTLPETTNATIQDGTSNTLLVGERVPRVTLDLAINDKLQVVDDMINYLNPDFLTDHFLTVLGGLGHDTFNSVGLSDIDARFDYLEQEHHSIGYGYGQLETNDFEEYGFDTFKKIEFNAPPGGHTFNYIGTGDRARIEVPMDQISLSYGKVQTSVVNLGDGDDVLNLAGDFGDIATTIGGAAGNDRVNVRTEGIGELVVGSDAGAPAHVKVFSAAGAEVRSFFPYGPTYTGGVRVAAGDLDGDGRADIITGAGPGAPGGHVKVFDGLRGGELRSFLAYSPSFTGGIFVASGDVNGDGRADIITGAGASADAPGGHVKVFDGATGAEIRSFLSFPGFGGGVNVAAGDVNGDKFDDIIVAAGPGAPGGHVKVFDGQTGALLQSFFAYPSAYAGGVHVAAGDVNGDGRSDVITGTAASFTHVKVFSGRDFSELRSFFAFPGFNGGVRVGAVDRNGDGRADIIAGVGPGAGPHVKVFDAAALAQLDSFFAFGPSFAGGVFVGGGNFDSRPGSGIFKFIGGGGSDILQVAGTGDEDVTIQTMDDFDQKVQVGLLNFDTDDVEMQDFHDLASLTEISPAGPQVLDFESKDDTTKVVLNTRKAGGTQQEYLTITLTDVFISSYQSGGLDTNEGAAVDMFLINDFGGGGGAGKINLLGGGGSDASTFFLRNTNTAGETETAPEYTFEGGEGSDVLSLNFMPAPAGGGKVAMQDIHFLGGPDTDELLFNGTGAEAAMIRSSMLDDAKVEIDDLTINYTGLESAGFDAFAAVDYFTPRGDNELNFALAGDGSVLKINDGSIPTETLSLNFDKVNAVDINGNDGNDSLSLNFLEQDNLVPFFPGGLNFFGGGGNDSASHGVGGGMGAGKVAMQDFHFMGGPGIDDLTINFVDPTNPNIESLITFDGGEGDDKANFIGTGGGSAIVTRSGDTEVKIDFTKTDVMLTGGVASFFDDFAELVVDASSHPGGANFLFGDGSVRFLTDAVPVDQFSLNFTQVGLLNLIGGASDNIFSFTLRSVPFEHTGGVNINGGGGNNTFTLNGDGSQAVKVTPGPDDDSAVIAIIRPDFSTAGILNIRDSQALGFNNLAELGVKLPGHTNGIQVALGDGSVRFIADSISTPTDQFSFNFAQIKTLNVDASEDEIGAAVDMFSITDGTSNTLINFNGGPGLDIIESDSGESWIMCPSDPSVQVNFGGDAQLLLPAILGATPTVHSFSALNLAGAARGLIGLLLPAVLQGLKSKGAGARNLLPAAPAVLDVGTLSLAPTAQIDVIKGAIVIRDGDLSSIANAVRAGRGSTGGVATGKWNGTTGITSSQAAEDFINRGNEATVVNYALNRDLIFPFSSFVGLAIDPSDPNLLLVRYTRNADFTLNGVVDDNDVSVGSGFYRPGVPLDGGPAQGDANYDGFNDDDDITILQGFYLPGAPPLVAETQSSPLADSVAVDNEDDVMTARLNEVLV